MKQNKKPSISNLYRGIILVMIPTLLCVSFLLVQAKENLRHQVVQGTYSAIENTLDHLGDLTNTVRSNIVSLLYNDENVQIFQRTDRVVDRNNAHVAIYNEIAKMNEQSLDECHYFYFNSEHNELILPASDYAIEERLRIEKTVMQYLQSVDGDFSVSKSKWRLITVEDSNRMILVKVNHIQNSYAGCWIDAETLYRLFSVNRFSRVKHAMVFVENEQAVVGETAIYEDVTGTLEAVVSRDTPECVMGNYSLKWYDFPKSNVSFVFLINIWDRYEDLQTLLNVLMVVMIIVLVSGVWLLGFMRRNLLDPIRAFVSNIALHSSIRPSTTRGMRFEELEQVDQMFQKAHEQIEQLKIEVYEQKLEQQSIEMEYLKLQIRPHFYLNCLNLIYNMAGSGHIEELKKLAMETSAWLRSTFRKGDLPITLKEELEHVRSYLSINAIRYQDDFLYEINADDEALSCQMMPLVVHTLVENSLRHALMAQNTIEIKVSARLEQDFLHIQITDTGNGFAPDVLEMLNNKESLSTESGHRVGLSNTIRRLNLLYQGRAKIYFSNQPSGGACVDVWIPLSKGDEA